MYQPKGAMKAHSEHVCAWCRKHARCAGPRPHKRNICTAHIAENATCRYTTHRHSTQRTLETTAPKPCVVMGTATEYAATVHTPTQKGKACTQRGSTHRPQRGATVPTNYFFFFFWSDLSVADSSCFLKSENALVLWEADTARGLLPAAWAEPLKASGAPAADGCKTCRQRRYTGVLRRCNVRWVNTQYLWRPCRTILSCAGKCTCLVTQYLFLGGL